MFDRLFDRVRSLKPALLLAAAATGALAPAGAQAQTCAQPSKTWLPLGLGGAALLENGGTQFTDTSINLYPTGIVKPLTRITYTFRDTRDFRLIRQQTTGAADGTCVVRHEPEEFSAGQLGVRSVTVDVTYTRWEDNSTVTRRLGILTVMAGGAGGDVFPSTCAQPSKAWVAIEGTASSLSEGGGRRTVTTAATLAMTGIVSRNTFDGARFDFVSRQGGGTRLSRTTQTPDANCVIRHEQERVSASVLGVGSYDVSVVYRRAETNQLVTANLGILEVQAPSGGGGEEPPPCPPGMICS